MNIPALGALAKLIWYCWLIMIVVASMLYRFYLEAIDSELCDLMNTPFNPFGRKILFMAGDFRQCLPVVPGSNRAQI